MFMMLSVLEFLPGNVLQTVLDVTPLPIAADGLAYADDAVLAVLHVENVSADIRQIRCSYSCAW